MEVMWTDQVANFFEGEEKVALAADLLKKIPSFIENHYYKIKPVRKLSGEAYPLLELRVHVGKKDYRLAFAEGEQDQKIAFFISPVLKKVEFEKLCEKYVHKNKDYLVGAKPIKEEE